jgi:hypothetical protein
MDNQIGRGLEGLAQIAAEKWFAAMGLVGLVLFFTALVFDLPTDRTSVICISLILIGFGFGQAECRNSQDRIWGQFKVTYPIWTLTFTGCLMFLLAIGAAVTLAVHTLI